ncbi:hypothetical protein NEOLEDRAFT_1182469 [Neolentinus lepideus HHB14362 ss-1]|uniref:Uncharacterized protein n=1 Tax=Neolentinus lepideus HHB14362 ss-1 TaxID=1314782 RepID=A0A165P4H5_9AGAM|nr:hypothetical protein NEOLEDRAFT_1182469 [Neolentinus lepideus HHB14362 ss-1]
MFAPRDARWIRIMDVPKVMVIFILDTFNTCADMVMIYTYTIKDFGKYDRVVVPNWPLTIEPITTGAIASIVQSFFAWRILILTKRKWIAVLVVILSIISSLAGVGSTVVTEVVKAVFTSPEFTKDESLQGK